MIAPGKQQLRVAVVGGGATIREHIRAFRDVSGVTVVGIWNRTREKARAVAGEFAIPFVASSIDELYMGTRADLAILAVYETAINSVFRQMLAHPWAILMEKPVGVDLADAQDIAAAAKAKGAKVFVGLNRRMLASTQTVLADLADDPGPRFICVQDQQSLEVARQLGHAAEVIDNWMYANSIHLIDYIVALGRGTVTEVTPVVHWNAKSPAPVVAKIDFDSGDVALYQGIWNGPGPWACSVTTPRRRWEMRPLEKAVFQNAGERKQTPVEPHPWDTQFKPGFRLQAERVVSTLHDAGGGATTIDEAMRTMRLVHEIFSN